MKKNLTRALSFILLFFMLFSNLFNSTTSLVFGQDVVPSFRLLQNGDFEEWSGSTPVGWMGSKSNIPVSAMIKYTQSSKSGGTAVQLIETGTANGDHKRFNSKAYSIIAGKEYTVTYWVRGKGQIRNAFYRDGNYSAYSAYTVVDSLEWQPITYKFSYAKSVNDVELIFSVLKTSAEKDHIQIDDVQVFAEPDPAPVVEPVTANVPNGAVEAGTLVSLDTTTTGASVYYTNNGETPTKESIPYTEPIVIDKTTTIKAIAFLGPDASSVTTYQYTVVTPSTYTNISVVKTLPKDSDITIEGIVTTKPGSFGGKGFYIQDATGGAYVFHSSNDFGVTRGNTVRVTGKTSEYNGGFQITPISVEIVSNTSVEPQPVEINLSTVEKENEGKLVKINNVSVTNIAVSSQKTATITVTDGINTRNVILDNRTGQNSDDVSAVLKVGDVLDVIGVVGHNTNGHRLLLRSVEDLVLGDETTVSIVKATPNSGAVIAGTEVTLSTSTKDATIFYTTTGGEPSTPYTEPIIINEATIIHTKAVKGGLEDSNTSSYSYTVVEAIGDTVTIERAKQLPVNTETNIEGIVTAVYGNREAYIQNSIAGIQINIVGIDTKVKVGDFISVKGKVSEFRGEVQFLPTKLDDITVISRDNTLPEAVKVTLKDAGQADGNISITKALTEYQGKGKTITVRGVITNKLPNGEYAMEIADLKDPSKVMNVQLIEGYRQFNITEKHNPSALGRIVLVTGQEENYNNKPAIKRVGKYDSTTKITTFDKYHVGFDIEGMRITTGSFEVTGKDANGLFVKDGDGSSYIYTGRATNFQLAQIKIGDWYSVTGTVAFYDKTQIKLADGKDLVFQVPPGQQDPREPLVLNAKPGNFVSIFDNSPLISANIEKTEDDIKFEEVKLFLDGDLVEHQLDEGSMLITYQATDLYLGQHDVTIHVPDVAGREKVFKWHFSVAKQQPNYKFFFGVPHSHTAYSDGAGTPTQAFEHARGNGLDFLVATDHSNWYDGVKEGNFEFNAGRNEYVETMNPKTSAPSSWWKTRLEAEAVNQKYAGDFLAIRGFEMTSSIWGHMNTINSSSYVEAKKQMVPLKDYYNWMLDVSTRPGENVFNMFNHPSWPDDSFSNLAYVNNLDRHINGIEVGNGAPPYSYHRSEGHYFKALDNGWRLGAMNAQDNHSTNWGDPDNLTVIIAEDLSTDNLIDAMNARRMYSTETKSLHLTVKGNGHWMGSVIDIAVGEEIDFEVLAEDTKVKIDKLQLITNGGHILDEKEFQDGTNSAEWNFSVTATGGAEWFVIKVIHSNGAWGTASPIFVMEGENDVKLTGIKVDPNPTLPGVETKLEATVSNMGIRPVSGMEVKFYLNTISENNLIGSATYEEALNSGGSINLSTIWIPNVYGQQRIIAKLTDIVGITTVTEISSNVKIVKPIGKKILFDGGHGNADVPGTVVKIIDMLRLYGYEATINYQPITPQLLSNVDVLIINTPLKVDNTFSLEEEQAIADWVKAGGSIMLAAKSNHNQNSTLFNSMMEKMGTTIRFNDDNIYEPVGSSKYTGGMTWSIMMSNLPETQSGLNRNMEAIRIFSGNSLIHKDMKPLINNPATGLEILLTANDTSYNALPGPNAYVYNREGELNGETIPVIAKELVGNGKIVAAGRHFYSDFEIGNAVSNTALTLQVIDWLAGYNRIRTIEDIRQNAKVGDVVTVRGVVTAPTNHFFDVFYIQDETSGVSVYGSQAKNNLPIGTEVIATGSVVYFEGELELTFENYDFEVIKVGPVDKVNPQIFTTKEAMSPNNTGKLVTTTGTIVDYNTIDGNFTIDDGSGAALIQIDGYLGLEMERFKMGDRVSVTGIASIGAAGGRIRVRFHEDLKLAGGTVVVPDPVVKPNPVIPTHASEKITNRVARRVLKLEETTVKYEEVTIFFPQKAFDKDILLSIEVLEDIKKLPMAKKHNIISKVLEITKDVSGDFNKSLKISIPFEKEKVDINKHEVVICWLNEETNEWVALDNIVVDYTNGIVTGEVNHFTKFAVLLNDKEVPSTVFKDIKDHWAQSVIEELVMLGAINGYADGTFKPERNITRGEFVKIIVNAFKLEAKTGKVFADTEKHFARNEIATAFAYGIVSGYDDTTFGANDPITREQMVAMLIRLTGLKEISNEKIFSDEDTISAWASEAIRIAVGNNIIGGYPDNTFRPKGNTTRAEAANTILRTMKTVQTKTK